MEKSKISLIDKIKNFQNGYLYEKIIYAINQNPYKKETKKYNNDSEKRIFDLIKTAMKKEAEKKGKDFEDDKITFKDMCDYFNFVYNICSKKKNQKQKRALTTILKNLLFKSDKNEVNSIFSVLNKESNNESEYNFTIRDFIYNFALEAVEKGFIEESKNEELQELFNTYLYLIFQVKDENFIIKLKILIYLHLYKERDLSNFIIETSKSILNEINFSKDTLMKHQKENKEIDINLKLVSENLTNFLNIKRNNIKDILKFFSIENMKKNYEKIELKQFSKEEIAVDNLYYNEKEGQKKIHLFSIEFLLTNGFKSSIDNSDFEMFNSDNYSIDTFAKFCNLIISEVNEFINQDNPSILKKELIRFHKYGLLYFISAKLNDDIKTKFSNKKKLELPKNNIFLINVKAKESKNDNKDQNNNNNKDKININITNNKDKININNNENKDKININNNDNNIKTDANKNIKPKNNEFNIYYDDSGSWVSSSKNSYFEFQKKSADFLEELVNDKLEMNIEKDKLINLPNILLMLNLKIPYYDVKTNSIRFNSVRLDSFNEKKKDVNSNYYYGCKEIDAIFQNKSEKILEVPDSNYFYSNLIYVKEKDEVNFTKSEEKQFVIYPNSLIFCEIKNSFPNIEVGREEAHVIKIQKNENENEIKENAPKTYDTHLNKFIKKFHYFFNAFKDINKNNEKVDIIHFIFLYDSFNIENNYEDSDFNKVTSMTEDVLYYYENKFSQLPKVIFQLVFFDHLQFLRDKYLKEKKEEKEKKEKKEIKEIKEKKEKKEIKEIKEKNEEKEIKEVEEKKETEEIKEKKEIEKDAVIAVKKIYGKIDLVNEILDDKRLNIESKEKKVFELFYGEVPLDIIKTFINTNPK